MFVDFIPPPIIIGHWVSFARKSGPENCKIFKMVSWKIIFLQLRSNVNETLDIFLESVKWVDSSLWSKDSGFFLILRKNEF